ncbi:MAG: flagellar protein FlaG [Nautiliaceae bacterium]|jgi:flagellar protein FlaG
MDIFSNIKNYTQKVQPVENMNQSEVHRVQKVEEAQKDVIENQDKEKLKKELQRVTEELNKTLNPLNTTLKFQFNDKVDELTVKVVDTTNNKTIREYPPKEALELMEKMRELVGLLLDKKG